MARVTNYCEQSHYRARWYEGKAKVTIGGLQIEKWNADKHREASLLVSLDDNERIHLAADLIGACSALWLIDNANNESLQKLETTIKAIKSNT